VRTSRRPLGRTAAVLALAAVLAACTGQDPTPAAPAGPVGPFPLTVDNCGQRLTVAAPPARVVALDQVAAEDLLQLGAASAVVGAPAADEAVFPTVAAAYKRLPVLAGGAAVAAAKPDLVVGDLDSGSFTGPGRSRVDLNARGIPSFALRCQHEAPDGAQVFSRYIELGRILGVPERAEGSVREAQAALSTTARALGDAPPVGAFLYRSGRGPLGTYGVDSPADYGLRLAGGRNVAAGATEVSVHTVLAAAPAAVVAADGKSVPAALRGARLCVVGRHAFGTPARMARDVARLGGCLHPGRPVPTYPAS
jgi:iron complex transport system substrate-binding protein